jgi:hypothetical protein
MSGVERAPQLAHHLEAENVGDDEIAARRAPHRRHGEHRGNDRGARMRVSRVIGIVIVERMSDRAVIERGVRGCRVAGGADERGETLSRGRARHHVQEHRRQRLACAGKHAAYAIGDRIRRESTRARRKVLIRGARRVCSELAGQRIHRG